MAMQSFKSQALPATSWGVSQQRAHVLVVDDDPVARRICEAALLEAGYLVDVADSGERGLASFTEHGADLVILDILMPGIDGFETCKRLRARPGGATIPIVFLTAQGDFSNQQRALDAGGNDFLAKPVSRNELLARVNLLLWAKRLREDLEDGIALIDAQREALLGIQKRKDELTQLIVHDLRGPLAGIRANLEVAAGEPGLSEDAAASVQDALVGVRALDRLIYNLLEVSRADDGVLVPRLAVIEVPPLLTEAARGAEPRLQARKQVMNIEVQPGLPSVRADRDLILRMIDNLFENAALYGPRGGRITVGAASLVSGFVDFWVSDEGPGIKPEDRERIFDKFVRLDPGQRAGRGLGLVFCRLAAEAHAGRIWVEDTPGGGASFRVRLPAGT